ncbi:MAG: CCA tRNA nucleotidyltransferase [Proteobacteria bacterium]|nr:CCA tRNA nucleotidyltransferase [Pseudomonadota bacterium]
MMPVRKIPPQDWMRAPETRAVIAALTAEGAEVRFVGGCVRDALAGRKVQDIDIATQLPPEEVMRLLGAAGIKAVPTGIQHGTVTAVAGGKPFEITTLRVDVETYGRKAKVAFTDDWTADAARRDFTFNALSCAPDGALYDPFDGEADLMAGRVRFVGEARARIEEDYLRLLRFFRFQAHFGKRPPDPEALEIAAELAPELDRLSGERIRAELLRLLQAPDPIPVVEIMIARRILRAILPTAPDAALLRALMRTEATDEPVDPILRLAAVLEPGREQAERIAERLRLSNRQRFALVYLLDPPLDPLAEVSLKDLHRAVRKLGAPLSRKLLHLSWARHHRGDERAVPDEAFQAAIEDIERLASKRFPLLGRDARALGVPEGPELGSLLEEVEEWWSERDFEPVRKACLERLRELIATA